ncbi:MAG TPA: sensor histidine kinase N-terminal domain-containing protein [Rhodocyclaceae bacterium]|nr:sensor histidine kinase N-terminal domain-containing protein [Rhodocyclaceae bacterium]
MPERRRYWWLRFAFDSLLGEVLLWIFSLLLFLWALSVVMTYQVANSVANQPYDEQLANDARAVAQLLTASKGKAALSYQGVARDLLRVDSRDRIFYQVIGFDGQMVAGDADIPWDDLPDVGEPGSVKFRDEEIVGEEVRVAYGYFAVADTGRLALVQIAETRKKRQGLAASMVSGVIVPQFVIVPLAVLLVYLGLARGITPLHRLQQELRQRSPSDLTPMSLEGIPEEIRPLIESMNSVMKRLDDNLYAQRRFIADAAHQLKTPLTGLRTQTELALRETEPQSLLRALRNVGVSAERLSHLTQQLLSLARAEATTEQAARFAVLDLRELARSVIEPWVDQALRKSIDLGYEAPDEPVLVVGSEFLLKEALNNLLDNAMKYTPAGGQVTLRVLDRDPARLEVEDSGPGIPDADQERVFERFYRGMQTEVEGSGLGLAIVREVAEQHGGTVSIASAAGHSGTIVTVTLPRAVEMG